MFSFFKYNLIYKRKTTGQYVTGPHVKIISGGLVKGHLLKALFCRCFYPILAQSRISYRNQSFDSQCKSNDSHSKLNVWFLYEMQHLAEMGCFVAVHLIPHHSSIKVCHEVLNYFTNFLWWTPWLLNSLFLAHQCVRNAMLHRHIVCDHLSFAF